MTAFFIGLFALGVMTWVYLEIVGLLTWYLSKFERKVIYTVRIAPMDIRPYLDKLDMMGLYHYAVAKSKIDDRLVVVVWHSCVRRYKAHRICCAYLIHQQLYCKS